VAARDYQFEGVRRETDPRRRGRRATELLVRGDGPGVLVLDAVRAEEAVGPHGAGRARGERHDDRALVVVDRSG
jgi:hypothetical protein